MYIINNIGDVPQYILFLAIIFIVIYHINNYINIFVIMKGKLIHY